MNASEYDKKDLWYQRSQLAQEALYKNFWNPAKHRMNQGFPAENPVNGKPIYWWHAHVIDVLVDVLLRSKDEKYEKLLKEIFYGVIEYNGGTLLNNFYDDMEWMGLALLRAWDATGEDEYKKGVFEVWRDIKTAWNSNCGGGMAWKKDQLDYKNTPANAPAAILACRLYERFKNQDDFNWGMKIFNWNKDNLVDPETGFVWDGLNRLGDGKIDKDWKFTYCQGVFVGAALELYKITQQKKYLDIAIRTAFAAKKELADPKTSILPYEGEGGDCGLFKGIFMRYIMELLKIKPDLSEISAMLSANAQKLWESGRNEKTGLFGPSWTEPPQPVTDLSAHLSGVMLTEMMACCSLMIR